ncbi:MAG: VOC family protein [Gammaproteobacteria bacterium]|jgi:predicted enzyme related to lactoylglutathione lyase
MNPVVHFEIPYEDPGRITAFYESAFGWRTQMLGDEMGNYILATTAEADVRPGMPAGAIDGGFYPKNPDRPSQHPSIVIAVDDIAESMAAIERAGGEVLGEPMNIPGVGHYVAFLDTEGNRSSLLQPAGDTDV